MSVVVESDSVVNPPCPVDPPPRPVDPIKATLNALNDESNYLLAENWFSVIQDGGIKLTAAEVETWCETSAKRKTLHITANGKHYKKLYGLSKKLFHLYFVNPTLFSKILKNKSDSD